MYDNEKILQIHARTGGPALQLRRGQDHRQVSFLALVELSDGVRRSMLTGQENCEFFTV